MIAHSRFRARALRTPRDLVLPLVASSFCGLAAVILAERPLSGALAIAAGGLVLAMVVFARRPTAAIYSVLALALSQDLLVLLASHFIPPAALAPVSVVAFALKEALLLVALAVRMGVRGKSLLKLDRTEVWCLLFLTCVGAYLIMPAGLLGGPDASLVARLISARSLLMFGLLFLLGRWTPVTSEELRAVLRFLIRLGLAGILVGALLSYLPSSVTQPLGLASVVATKGVIEPDGYVANGQADLGPNFYFQEFTPQYVPQPGIRRLSSSIVEPISAGLVYALLFALSAALGRDASVAGHSRLFGLATLLSLSRGGLVLAAFAWLLIRVRRVAFVAIFGVGVLAAVFGVYMLVLPQTLGVSGTVSRLAAFGVIGEAVVRWPLGRGLGTAGYLVASRIATDPLGRNDDIPAIANESYLATLVLQIGVIGLAAYSGFVISGVRSLLKLSRAHRRIDAVIANTALAVAGCLTAILPIGAISASGYGFVGLGLIFLLAGLVMSAARSTVDRRTIEQRYALLEH